MKEHPILFSAEMVRAIRAGRKTQTRRIIKPAPSMDTAEILHDKDLEWREWFPHAGNMLPKSWTLRCPYGQLGDRLWVRESYYQFGHWEPIEGKRTKTGRQKWQFISHMDAIRYLDSTDAPKQFRGGRHHKHPSTPAWHKRLARFMPRVASRITLEVTTIRAERLQDITPDDCRAEGQPRENNDIGVRYGYGKLWNQINGPGSWDANPWVWVVEFKPLIHI